MTTDKSIGWYTFLHHDIPIEYTWDLAERMRAIEQKSLHEIATRKRCIVRVDPAWLPIGYTDAQQVYAEAERVYAEAKRVYNEAWRVYAEAGRVYDKAGRVYDKAKRVYDGARWVYAEAQQVHTPLLLTLALRLVPDAPWDTRRGALVFPS